MLNFEVNLLGVFVAALVAYIVGAVWYTILDKPWRKEAGLTDKMMKESNPLQTYGGSFVLFLFISFFVAVVMKNVGYTNLADALVFGLLFAAFSTTVSTVNKLYELKSWTLIAIDAANYVLYTLVMVAILFWFK